MEPPQTFTFTNQKTLDTLLGSSAAAAPMTEAMDGDGKMCLDKGRLGTERCCCFVSWNACHCFVLSRDACYFPLVLQDTCCWPFFVHRISLFLMNAVAKRVTVPFVLRNALQCAFVSQNACHWLFARNTCRIEKRRSSWLPFNRSKRERYPTANYGKYILSRKFKMPT